MNIYAPNMGAAKYINQLIIKVKTYLDNNTLILGNFNRVLSVNDRYSKHNITKETRALNDKLNQKDFTDIYRTLHPNTPEYTFFSSAHGTFSRIGHILGHKSENQSQGHHNVRFQVVQQSRDHQDSVVLTQKQTHRSMEQNRESRMGPQLYGQLIFDKAQKTIH
uniref:Uncharacterized protein n=1 Tax=Canis lupus dingo TaxID=286419 RepID=A0A8C0JWL0_CANLU